MRFQDKIMLKYQNQLNKLHKVGDGYVDGSNNNELAKENLFKIYHGYHIAGLILSYGILVFALIMALAFKQYFWLIITPFSFILPITFRWSMQNVLNINLYEYTEWRKKRKK